ncbi:MAG: NapC/NirT family cytochrome c [Phycisphaerae bacterium]
MTGSRQASDGGAESKNPRTNEPEAAGLSRPSRWRRRIRRLGLVLAIVVVAVAVVLVTTEYYTARPDFCRSCHIMEPYYQTWTRDVHGSKLSVACVECHDASGEQHTIRAKLRGLSQVAGYFSGRSGSTRMRTHVSDGSCLTSECHGDGLYLNKVLSLGKAGTETRVVNTRETELTRAPTVSFVHSKHLQAATRLDETTKAIEQTAARLKTALRENEVYVALAREAVSVGSSPDRDARIREKVRQAGSAAIEADALAWGRLERLKIRLKQLSCLTCAACHTYDASARHHQAVDRQVCFTCHFSHEIFNKETAECLRCHEAPTRQIAVHEWTTSQPSPVVMNHQEIVRRNIDCSSCHADVVKGQGQVTIRECLHCHDQERYTAEFAERTIKQVEDYHRVHVAGQHARCADCHEIIRHELAAPIMTASREGFLQVVLENCQHCHPNHHHEQVQLLAGIGGQGPTLAMPNAMFGSRTNCRACHTQPGSDLKGASVITATASACVACHNESYGATLDQWIHEIAVRLQECDDSLKDLDKRIEQARSQGRDVPPRVLELAAQIRANVQFLQLGNGIHNRNYALVLLDISEAGLRQAAGLLPEP